MAISKHYSYHFKPVDNPDFIVPVEIDGIVHQVGDCLNSKISFILL